METLPTSCDATQLHQRRHHHGQIESKMDSLDSDYEDDYEGEEDDLSLPLVGSYVASNCSTCIQREELRKRNLEVIKDQILSKLGMRTAPNMTGRLPPRIPPLNHLLDLYGMQGDAPQKGFQTGPVYDEEEDDFHARTEKVIAFGQPRKFNSNLILNLTNKPEFKSVSDYFSISL